MELKITSNDENKLLNRREIKFSVEQEDSTPSKDVLTKEICKRLNQSPESTIIVRVDQGFGKRESIGVAHAYENKQAMEKYEPKYIRARLSKKSVKGAKEEPKSEDKAEAGTKAE